MKIEITKQDFDLAVKAAQEPTGNIFGILEDSIWVELAQLERQTLGNAGAKAVESDPNSMLVQTVKRIACIRAFLGEMRSLDLVLTSTGFGVVSTNDTAPASKQRVDALDGQLRRQERLLHSELVAQLFGVEGWNQQGQRRSCVPTLFFHFAMLEQYAAISRPKPEDWDQNVPSILAADNHLRKHMGHAYMEELLTGLTSNSLREADHSVVELCLRFTGAWVAQNHLLKQETYCRLINRLEADLSLYPTYADSEAYRLNHFTPYENHAEDAAFHFVG